MARWFLFERQWRLFVEISKVQSDHFQQVRKQWLLARFHQIGIVLTFLFSPIILIEMRPIGGTIKRDLQKKLGPITSLMDEISTPISIVCGSLHKPIQINYVLNFWQTVWIAKDAFTDSDKFSTSSAYPVWWLPFFKIDNFLEQYWNCLANDYCIMINNI